MIGEILMIITLSLAVTALLTNIALVVMHTKALSELAKQKVLKTRTTSTVKTRKRS